MFEEEKIQLEQYGRNDKAVSYIKQHKDSDYINLIFKSSFLPVKYPQ